jgi:hypothetical protein
MKPINTRETVVANFRATCNTNELADFDECSTDDQFTIACEELNFDPDKPEIAYQILRNAIRSDSDAFRAALIKQAEMHDDYAGLSRDARAAQGARASRNACLSAYDVIGQTDIDARERAFSLFRGPCGAFVVALNVACKLHDISPALRTRAATEYEG